jgi:hypothetical protein
MEGRRLAIVRTYRAPVWWKRYYTEREPLPALLDREVPVAELTRGRAVTGVQLPA